MIVRNIEIPIGTEIIIQDINRNITKTICKEGGKAINCLNCIFCGSETCNKMFCEPHVRSDNKYVYFEKISETDTTTHSTGEEVKSNIKKFIKSVQHWKDDKGYQVTHIEIMSTDAIASCRLSLYLDENVQILSNVYVNENYRTLGYCNQMLDYIDKNCNYRPHTLVYINHQTNEYIRQIYKKRNYIILIN